MWAAARKVEALLKGEERGGYGEEWRHDDTHLIAVGGEKIWRVTW